MGPTRDKIHAQIRSNVITSEPWKVGGDSAYKREFFVYNVNGGYALTAAGHIRRFSKLESASALADSCNLADQQTAREALANRRGHIPGPGRSFEQAELEDEIASSDACSVKVWSNDGIGETKRLHISDHRGTAILKGVIIAASDTQVFEAVYGQLEEETDLLRGLYPEQVGSQAHVEMLQEALEAALTLLGLEDLLKEGE